jgi:hypothetical protein
VRYVRKWKIRSHRFDIVNIRCEAYRCRKKVWKKTESVEWAMRTTAISMFAS